MTATLRARAPLAAALATLLLAGTAQAASPIDGRWTCHEQMNRNGLRGTIDSVADFRPDGTLVTALVMKANKLVVPIRVEATYNARWMLEGGKLIEQATGANVTSFTIAGVDSLNSEHAADFKSELMSPGTPPDVVMLSDTKFELRQPGRVTTCAR